MKYLVFERNSLEIPVIFPDWIEHREVLIDDFNIISAGHCVFREPNSVVCFGKSIGLNVESRQEDSELLSRLLNTPSLV